MAPDYQPVEKRNGTRCVARRWNISATSGREYRTTPIACIPPVNIIKIKNKNFPTVLRSPQKQFRALQQNGPVQAKGSIGWVACLWAAEGRSLHAVEPAGTRTGNPSNGVPLGFWHWFSKLYPDISMYQFSGQTKREGNN